MRPTTSTSTFLSLLFTLGFSSITNATPTKPVHDAAPSAGWGNPPVCLPPAIATEVVNQFASLLTNFSATVATNLLAPSFTDTSDSIDFLAGIPLGSVTFPSAQAFIVGQGEQPPIGFTIVNIDAITCAGTVVFRWIAQVGSKQYEVKGIDILDVRLVGKNPFVVGPTGWQLTAVYSEFNSGAWVLDIGGTCVPPKF